MFPGNRIKVYVTIFALILGCVLLSQAHDHTEVEERAGDSSKHKKGHQTYYNAHGTCDGKPNKHTICCNYHNFTKEHGGFVKEKEWCSNQMDKGKNL